MRIPEMLMVHMWMLLNALAWPDTLGSLNLHLKTLWQRPLAMDLWQWTAAGVQPSCIVCTAVRPRWRLSHLTSHTRHSYSVELAQLIAPSEAVGIQRVWTVRSGDERRDSPMKTEDDKEINLLFTFREHHCNKHRTFQNNIPRIWNMESIFQNPKCEMANSAAVSKRKRSNCISLNTIGTRNFLERLGKHQSTENF